MDEVSLIEVAAVRGNGGPNLIRAAMKLAKNVLKPPDTLEGLGCEAGLLAKHFHETPAAEAGLFREMLNADSRAGAAQLPGGKSDLGEQRPARLQARKQASFEDAEHGRDARLGMRHMSGCHQHFFAEESGVAGPQVVKAVGVVGHFGSRHIKEGKCAARVKLDADHAFLAAGVDDEAVAARSAKDCGRIGGRTARVGRVVNVNRLIAEVEDDARLPIGQQTLLGVRPLKAFRVPEARHQGVQWRCRNLAAVDHEQFALIVLISRDARNRFIKVQPRGWEGERHEPTRVQIDCKREKPWAWAPKSASRWR